MNGLATYLGADFLQAEWVERVGWALVHSLWQIAVVAGVYAAAMPLLRRRSARARYKVGCVTLLVMLALPVGTYMVLPRDATSPAVAHPAHGPSPSVSPFDAGDLATSDNNLVEPDAGAVDARAASRDGAARESSTNAAARELLLAVSRSWLRPYLPWATVAWLAGVLALSLRPLAGWLHVRRLQRYGLSPLSEAFDQVGERLLRRLGVQRAVRFAQSSLVEVPAVVGYLRPLVLLPVSAITGLSTSQIEMILAHELAHVRRHDYLANVAQTVIEALLFYHPGMWWVSARVREEREHCCDDLAVLVCGNRAAYARTLLCLEERRTIGQTLALSATGGSLVARVRRIVGAPGRADDSQGNGKWLSGLVVLLLLGLPAGLVMYQHHLAQAAEDPARNSADADPSADQDANPRGDQDPAATGQPAAKQLPRRDGARPNGLMASLVGRFIYDGEPVVSKRIEIPPYIKTLDGQRHASQEREHFSKMEIPDESLLVGKDGGIANVFVWVKSKDIPKPLAPDEPLAPVIVRAKQGRFQPHVLAFWNAAPLKFVNEMLPYNVNFKWDPLQGRSHNPLLTPDLPEVEFEANAESLPLPVSSNIQPWMRAHILPLDHEYFDVTGEDGRFALAHIPPGTWEFAFWHEGPGWLRTERFPKGRFTLKVRPGENSLGDLLVSPESISKSRRRSAGAARPQPANEPNAEGRGEDARESIDRSVPREQSLDEASEANAFFPPDPYPELGIVRNAGPGWHFLRVAGHAQAAGDLGIDHEQQEAIKLLFDVYLGKDRDLEAKL